MTCHHPSIRARRLATPLAQSAASKGSGSLTAGTCAAAGDRRLGRAACVALFASCRCALLERSCRRAAQRSAAYVLYRKKLKASIAPCCAKRRQSGLLAATPVHAHLRACAARRQCRRMTFCGVRRFSLPGCGVFAAQLRFTRKGGCRARCRAYVRVRGRCRAGGWLPLTVVSRRSAETDRLACRSRSHYAVEVYWSHWSIVIGRIALKLVSCPALKSGLFACA